MAKDDHEQIATVKLSGEPVLVGVYSHTQGSSVYFKTDDNAEPIYMSTAETKMLISCLKVAVSRLEGDT